MKKARVAILISGRGSNMQSLIAACEVPDFPCEIVAVLSNKNDAQGLVFARDKRIATYVIPHKDFSSREEHDLGIHEKLLEISPDIIALAGYMRILTPQFVAKWHGKMINIHPSLLPKYKGTHTHARALEAGDVEHGCSVHFVTADLDDGPVIAQARVPILAHDSVETLSARVLEQEHLLYPQALAIVAKSMSNE